jgi:DNA-binding NarL/FixJ family response regulator
VRDAPIGLSHDCRTIDRALETAADGSTQVALIAGGLGSGRSTLLRASRDLAEGRSMRILSTQGRRTDRGVGYSCLLTLLSGIEEDLDQLSGPYAVALRSALSLSMSETDPVDVGLGLFRILNTLAERSPVAILVDDLHLVDSATSEALCFALGRLDVDAVAAVMTVPDAASSRFTDLAHLILTIAPLPVADLAKIVGAGFDVEQEVLRAVCERSAGNPLVALAMAESLTVDQRAARDPLPRVPRPPEALVRHFESAVSDLGEHARRTLVVVAAETDGDKAIIESALQRLGEPPDGLRLVAQAGLVILDGPTVRLVHPLLQAYAYHQVGEASRRAAHRALSEVLVAPSQAASRVWQLAAATVGSDRSLAESLELVASDALRRSDPVSGGRALVRAAELSELPVDARRRRREAAKVAFEAGFVDEAIGYLDGAGPGEASVAELASARQAVMRWAGGGHRVDQSSVAGDHELAATARAIDVGERDLLEGRNDRLIEADPTSVHWDPCELVILRVRALLAAGQTAAAESLTAARLAALDDQRTAVAAAVAAVRADVLAATGDLDGATRLAGWARPLLQERSLAVHLAGLDHTIGRIAMARGDYQDAVVALERIPAVEMHRAVFDLVLALLRTDDPAAARAWCLRLEDRDELVPRIRRLCADGLLGAADSISEANRLATESGLPMEVAGALVAESESLRLAGKLAAAADVEANARAHLRPLGACYLLGSSVSEAEPGGNGVSSSSAAEVAQVLSPAELRVAASVATGRTNKEAAAELYISVKTVDFHLQNTYRKLGLRSRTELAVRMSGTNTT